MFDFHIVLHDMCFLMFVVVWNTSIPKNTNSEFSVLGSLSFVAVLLVTYIFDTYRTSPSGYTGQNSWQDHLQERKKTNLIYDINWPIYVDGTRATCLR